jgi:hypothetical protein
MYADENNKHLSAFKVHSINIHNIFCQELVSVTMMRKEHIKSSPYEKHNRKLRANKMAPPFLIKLDLVVMYH